MAMLTVQLPPAYREREQHMTLVIGASLRKIHRQIRQQALTMFPYEDTSAMTRELRRFSRLCRQRSRLRTVYAFRQYRGN
jgi:hypothetical protein